MDSINVVLELTSTPPCSTTYLNQVKAQLLNTTIQIGDTGRVDGIDFLIDLIEKRVPNQPKKDYIEEKAVFKKLEKVYVTPATTFRYWDLDF